MRVALTGATGYLGRFVSADLHAQGHQLRALSRAHADRSGFACAIEWIDGDLRDPLAHTRLLEGADALIHLAFEHVPGRYRGGEGRDLQGFLTANLYGSLDLLLRARALGVQRAVLLSTRAVYGQRYLERILDERHPALPDSHYGAHKAALEAFVSAFGRGEGWPICALRPTGVYGLSHPLGRSKWYDLVRATLDERAHDDSRGGTEVHGRDLARAVRLLLEAPAERIAGEVFNCSDLYVSNRDVARLVQTVSGVRGPLPAAPAAMTRDVMVCTRLKALGMTFGGRPLLEQTVAELVAAIRNEPTGEHR